MHVLLDADQQNRPENYPPWCNLSWFHNCVGIDADVERHYHDLGEIWLWHEGRAEGEVGGETVPLRPGVMVYTPAGCQHAYRRQTRHSNTGIVPRGHPGVRRGHLHVDETGEAPVPETAPFWFAADENTPASPARFPREAFLESAYHGGYARGEQVWKGSRDAWWALLVRAGRLTGLVEGTSRSVATGELLIVHAGTHADIRAAAPSDVVFAFGWPS